MNENTLEYIKEEYQKRLNRLGHQLELTRNTLEKHAFTQDKLMIVQVALSYLNLQTKWSSAGPLARFLIMSQSALLGHETEKSAAGFIGPHLGKVQQATIQLMSGMLPPVSIGLKDLLATVLQLMTIGIVYLATQSLGNSKDMFPRNDPIEAKRAGLLFQELGLIFILGSGVINHLFRIVAEELQLGERQQKVMEDVGLLYVCILLIALRNDEQLIESLQGFMIRPLDSIETAIQKLQDQETISERATMQALSHLQLVKRTLEGQETLILLDVFKDILQSFNVSYKNLKDDLDQLTQACAQLSQTFNNIFYQVEKTVTTIDQAA